MTLVRLRAVPIQERGTRTLCRLQAVAGCFPLQFSHSTATHIHQEETCPYSDSYRAHGLMLQALGLDTGMYSLHCLRIGVVRAAYMAWPDQLHIKRHGMWSSQAFWASITAPVCPPLNWPDPWEPSLLSVCNSRILINSYVTYSSKCIFAS